VVVLSADDFAVLHEARDSQKHITELRYAPRGDLLAAGSHDHRVYVYAFGDGSIRLQHMITQHSAAIRRVDFSAAANVAYMRTCCAAGELCFFEADTGMFIPAASRLKDVRWHSATVPLGWASQGVHAAENDGSRVTAVDAPIAEPRPVLAAGDAFGRVRLYRYPCTSALAKAKTYRGHAAPVAAARWAAGASHLVTIGARDRCVLQWARIADDVAEEERASREMTAAASSPAPTTLASAPAAAGTTDTTADSTEATPGRTELALASDVDELAQADAGDVATNSDADTAEDDVDLAEATSKPWLLACVPPTHAPRPVLEPPDISLGVRWVHGVQAELARGAVAYNGAGDIVYASARLAVIYARAPHAQTYYAGHDHLISALAASPCGRFVASGDRQRRARVHIWDAHAGAPAAALPPRHRGAV